MEVEDEKKARKLAYQAAWYERNRGQYGWHVDHIIPLSSAKTREELIDLCHYKNLQPLWWRDNIIKGAAIPLPN